MARNGYRQVVDWVVQRPPGDPTDHGHEPDVPVWVSIAQFDALWRKTDEYVRDAGGSDDNQAWKYARAGEMLRSGKPVDMPYIGLSSDGLPSIGDGRHRYLWMREHGALSMPMAVHPDEAAAFHDLCGTRSRTSWFVLPPRPLTVRGVILTAGLSLGVLALVRRFSRSD